MSNLEWKDILSWNPEEFLKAVYDYEASRKLLELSRCLPDGAEDWTEVDAVLDNPDGTSRYWKLVLIRSFDLWESVPRSEGGSIQEAVIKALKSSGDVTIEDEFLRERSEAWKLVVEQAEREMLCSNDLGRVKDDREQLDLAGRIHRSSRMEAWMPKISEALDSDDGGLLRELAKHMDGGRKGGANEKMLCAGILWTAPSFPLWLMGNFLRSQIARIFDGHVGFGDPLETGSGVRKLHKEFESHFNTVISDRTNLTSRENRIIVGIKETKSAEGKFFGGYEFSGLEEEGLKNIAIWCPPGYLPQPNTPHRSLHEFSAEYSVRQ